MNQTLLAALVAGVLSQDPTTRQGPIPASQQDSTPLIIPAWCKEKPGGGNNNIPFSWTPVRWQQVFAPEAFGGEGTLLLGGMRFRMAPSFRGYKGGIVELEVALSTDRVGFGNTSTVFDENVASDRQVVVPRQKVEVSPAKDLPEEAKESLDVWDVGFTFARPFKFHSERGLVLEVKVFGNDQGAMFTFPLDAWPGSDDIAHRLYAEPGKPDGAAGGPCLVVCFDVLARAAGPASRPAAGTTSRPAHPETHPESRAAGHDH